MTFTPLTRETERDLIAKAQAGDLAARDRLVESQYRWVWKVARRFERQCKWMEIEDVVQVGLMGLVRAIEKFDLSANTRLTTYAFWHIRAHIQRAIETSCIIQLNQTARNTRNSVAYERAWKATCVSRFDSESLMQMPDTSLDDSEEYERKSSMLHRAIARLPKSLRLTVEAQLTGENLREAAEREGVCNQAVQQRRKRALTLLREMCA